MPGVSERPRLKNGKPFSINSYLTTLNWPSGLDFLLVC